MHGDLSVKRDFSDVRDVVNAYKLLIEKGNPHTPYNVCSGKSSSLQEILAMFISMSGAKIESKLDAEKLRPADMPEMVGSNEKIRAETGWKPRIELKQTLSDILDYWRKRL